MYIVFLIQKKLINTMKKYITIFGFFALFLVGTQFAGAQEQVKKSPEAIAKQKTYQLHELVNLTGDQQGDIFRLFVDSEQNLQALDAKGGDAVSVQKNKNQILEYVDQKLNVILTPEQYRAYTQSQIQESANKASNVKKKD